MDRWEQAVTKEEFAVIPYSDETKSVLTDSRFGSAHPNSSHLALVDMDGPTQELLHALVSRWLRRWPSSESMQAQIDAACRAMPIPGDVVADVVRPVLCAALFDVCGVDPQYRDVLVRHLTGTIGGLHPIPMFHTAREAVGNLTLELFRMARTNPAGLFAELLDLADQGVITRKQAVATMLTVLHGGYENPLLLLGSYIRDRLCTNNRSSTEAVISRFGPVHAVARYPTEPVAVAGCPFRTGQQLWVRLDDGDRRPLPFGFGSHACPAAGFTRRLVSAFVAYDVERWGWSVTEASDVTSPTSAGCDRLVVARTATADPVA